MAPPRAGYVHARRSLRISVSPGGAQGQGRKTGRSLTVRSSLHGSAVQRNVCVAPPRAGCVHARRSLRISVSPGGARGQGRKTGRSLTLAAGILGRLFEKGFQQIAALPASCLERFSTRRRSGTSFEKSVHLASNIGCLRADWSAMVNDSMDNNPQLEKYKWTTKPSSPN
ncbi:hypothetical protein Mal15_01980 [Stieleria maiorica]|uniref:Uncharacterized protein n=1 Tax=Stieleria maiorica TaxID=2795974 RepID=A0A5B9M4V6_9BACT|nr:hypothetical protein Mal15_01980 [Stieleria maiorica]